MTAPVYLLQGEEFLAEEGLQKVRTQTGADPLSEAHFDSGVDATELLTALETPSLLGGPRLVIVMGAQDLKKDQYEPVERYLESPSPYSVLVLVASGRTKLDAAVRRAGEVISLDAPKGRRLVAWLRQRAREQGLKLDERGAWALIDAVGTELRDLDGALQQLVANFPAGTIGPAQVKHAFPRLADERIFAFMDAVGDRRLPLAMTTLRRLLDQGDEPLVIFGSLAGQIRRMLRAKPLADRGAGAVGNALGLPGWRAERLTKQARAYREEELAAAMSILARTDIEMKGAGELSPAVALERAVIEIVGAPNPAAR